ncbi:MAG TPA: hypothetical protein VGH38_25095, partial [Bryobacteraceae bacterium]
MRSMHLPLTMSGGTLSRGLRSGWIAILALSPLAYFGATRLQNRLPHQEKFLSIGRDRAIEVATNFAHGIGIETRGWDPATSVETHDEIATLMRHMRPPAVNRIAAPATIDVRLSGPSRRFVKVNVTPDGRVIGFSSNKPTPQSTPIDEQVQRRIAEDFLRQKLGPDNPFRLENLKTRDVDKTGWEREFTWNSEVPGLPKAKAEFHVNVAGNQTVRESSTVKLDRELENEMEPSRVPKIILGIAVAICYVVFGIYALMRYIRRSIEREISHRRTLLVVAVFAICGVVATGLSGAETNTTMNGETVTGTVGLIVLGLVLAIPGLLFGIAYGAGEGDLREAFPGKLASVDAFLSGKLLSANCARSILAGGAFAGWMLLIGNLLLLLVHGGPIGDRTDMIKGALERSPLMGLVVGLLLNLTILTAFGLMLPLTFLRSRIRSPWLTIALLLPLSALVATAPAPGGHTWQNDLVLESVYATAVCAPFFFGDLLASVSSLFALGFVGALLRNSVVSDRWHTIAYTQVLPASFAFLGVALYCAWRGRVYGEAEVRPLYARHLVERLALTAEIGAARLAQVRLLPDAAPRIAGLSIAGSCTPAREVGGDFFDYYALDDHRLGVFLAEGGNR